MDETYERQLREIAGRLPDGPGVVALLPTLPLDQAAALANDAAQSIGAGRAGHTLLTSFETPPARLDHEIGLEEGPGLTDVLAGRAAMREVAAHGRARRFIYVPAGSDAGPGERLLRSPGWRGLAARAVASGGTVLAFVPTHVFEAALSPGAEGEAPPFDALLWLGSAEHARDGVRRAARASGAHDLGHLEPPGGHLEPAPVEPAGRVAAETGVPSPHDDPAAPEGAVPSAPVLVRPGRRRRARRGRGGAIAAAFIIVALAVLGAWLIVLSRDATDWTEDPVNRFAAPDSLP